MNTSFFTSFSKDVTSEEFFLDVKILTQVTLLQQKTFEFRTKYGVLRDPTHFPKIEKVNFVLHRCFDVYDVKIFWFLFRK